MKKNILAVLLVTAALSACGGDTGDASGLTTENRSDIYNSNAATSTTVELLNAVDGALVDFDPTINPAQTAEQNAMNVAAKVRMNGACAMATVNGSTVTATFGNCTLPNGATLNGQITIAVSKNGNIIALAFTLANVSVNGKAVSGMVTMTTTTGTSFTASGTFTVTTQGGANSVALNNLLVTASSGQYTASGMFTSTVNGTATSVGIAAMNPLTYRQGECYPRAGTAIATRGSQRYTVTFDTVTATCGSVSVRVNNIPPVRVALPAYGTCPNGMSCPPAITVSELLQR